MFFFSQLVCNLEITSRTLLKLRQVFCWKCRVAKVMEIFVCTFSQVFAEITKAVLANKKKQQHQERESGLKIRDEKKDRRKKKFKC